MGKSKIQEPTATKFSVKGFDRAHFRQTEQYVRIVDKLFDKAMAEIAKAAKRGEYDPDKPFTFDDYPVLKVEVEKIVARLAKNMTTTIETGSKQEWLFANKKNDGWIAAVFDTSKLTKAQLAQLQDRNLDGLAAFQARKVQGMDLSQRVWRYVGQFKEQIQDCLDIGIGDGTSAMRLASEMKKYLNNPDMLFRRVRDKHGNLHLSKRAAAYHPGRGVYRSSARNAQRLTRSEINMAYREADFQRWKRLDFVVGIEIQRSNNLEKRKTCKLCDRLAGRYPKDFKFVGWHPQCMCFATPIMSTEEEFDNDELESLRAAFRGETKNPPVPSQNTVTDLPAGFKEWVEENKDRQQDWATTPYFIRDNFKDGELAGGLKFSLPDIKAIAEARINAARSRIKVEEKEIPPAKTWETATKAERTAAIAEWNSLYNEVREWESHLIGNENNANLGDEAHAIYEALGKCDPDLMRDDLIQVLPELKSKWESIKTRYATAREECKAEARKCLDDFRVKVVDAMAWIRYLEDKVGLLEQKFLDEASKKFPDYYPFIKDWASYHISQSFIDIAKKNFNDVVARGQQELTKALATGMDLKGHDSILRSYLTQTPTKDNPSWDIIDNIEKEIKELKKLTQKSTLDDVVVFAKDKMKIDFKEVKAFPQQPTEEEIIKRLGGGDRTKGSCSSLAFAYAGNKAGLDVLDFRDGKSREMFASGHQINEIARKVGGEVVTNKNGFTNCKALMKTVVEGKEYYFAVGQHAAIIRKTSTGFEYLELQSMYSNGWHPLNDAVLKNRFGVKKSRTIYGTKLDFSDCIIDIELLKKNAGFRDLLGYINTKESEQRKGTGGTIK